MKVANANLIGDLSLEHSLELSVGPRAKFKYITAETLYNFMLFGHSNIQSLQIIDSRYKYEFDGGHINGAINIPSAVSSLLLLPPVQFTFREKMPKSLLIDYHHFLIIYQILNQLNDE